LKDLVLEEVLRLFAHRAADGARKRGEQRLVAGKIGQSADRQQVIEEEAQHRTRALVVEHPARLLSHALCRGKLTALCGGAQRRVGHRAPEEIR
jgi:hypothetical protein